MASGTPPVGNGRPFFHVSIPMPTLHPSIYPWRQIGKSAPSPVTIVSPTNARNVLRPPISQSPIYQSTNPPQTLSPSPPLTHRLSLPHFCEARRPNFETTPFAHSKRPFCTPGTDNAQKLRSQNRPKQALSHPRKPPHFAKATFCVVATRSQAAPLAPTEGSPQPPAPACHHFTAVLGKPALTNTSPSAAAPSLARSTLPSLGGAPCFLGSGFSFPFRGWWVPSRAVRRASLALAGSARGASPASLGASGAFALAGARVGAVALWAGPPALPPALHPQRGASDPQRHLPSKQGGAGGASGSVVVGLFVAVSRSVSVAAGRGPRGGGAWSAACPVRRFWRWFRRGCGRRERMRLRRSRAAGSGGRAASLARRGRRCPARALHPWPGWSFGV